MDILGTRTSSRLPPSGIFMAVPYVHVLHGGPPADTDRRVDDAVGVLSAASDGDEHGPAHHGDVAPVVPEYNFHSLGTGHHTDEVDVPLRVWRELEKDELRCMK